MKIHIFRRLLPISFAVGIGISATVFAQQPTPSHDTKSSNVFFEPIGDVSLRIDFDSETIAAQSGQKKIDLRTICKRIGRGFLLGQGYWETGFARNVTCYQNQKIIDSIGTTEADNFEVLVTVKDVSSNVVFGIGQRNLDGIFSPFKDAQIELPINKWTTTIIADEDFSLLIAYSLVDSCPFIGKFVTGSIDPKKNRIKKLLSTWRNIAITKFDQPKAPKGLTFYKLKKPRATPAFFAEHFCDARLATLKRKRVKIQGKGSSTTQITSMADYQITQSSCAGLKQFSTDKVFVHTELGPGGNKEANLLLINTAYKRLFAAADSGLLERLLSEGYGSIANLIYATTASGYTGFRLGYQLLKGKNSRDKMLDGAQMYGLLVEVRAGPMEGLKFYYDKFPMVREQSSESQSSHLEWSRFVVGKSFILSLPYFVNKVELTPKIGRIFLASKLPIEFDSDGKTVSTQQFEIRNQPSFSIEAAVERAAEFYTARLWYATDQALSFLPVLGSSSISAQRFGVDYFLNSGLTFNLSDSDLTFNVLGFSFYENLTIEDLKLKNLDAGEVAVSAVSLRTAYAGIGFILNW